MEATIRVLDDVGEDLTTTRVAEVAGVSVGTLYQYFPNRDALINAVLADHLDGSIGAVVRACEDGANDPLPVAIERVVRAFLAEKALRADNSRILNKAFGTGLRPVPNGSVTRGGAGMLDDRPLVRAAVERAHRAIAALLARHEPDDAAMRLARLGCDALEGMVRGALATPDTLRDPVWIDQVVRITLAALARTA